MLNLTDIVLALNDSPGPGAFIISTASLPVDVEATDENGQTPIVFVPDLHLLSHERSEGYGDYFNLNRQREDLLTSVLQQLVRLRDAPQSQYSALRVFQLGDFHDLWRESEHWWWDEDIRAMVDRQLQSHLPLFDLFRQLATERLVGNHDKRIRDEKAKLAGEPIDFYFPVDKIYPFAKSFQWGAFNRIDLIHADIFDKTETGFFHFLNPVGARLAEHDGTIAIGDIDEWQHEIDPPGTPDGPGSTVGIEPAFIYAGESDQSRYFKNARDYFLKSGGDVGFASLPPVATIIGHTHFPRIVLDNMPSAYSLIDCGSWVNQSFKTGSKEGFWNGQIGFLTGNQIGIVQIGRT
jgi:UDP-2,3-diacylglucosamine pyrophosphatase LpxH